jgi:hypothetical protein
VNLSRRLGKYYNLNQLAISNMVINKALLKHDIAKFKLEILKYCSPDECIKWEQFYLDLLKPEYNILQIAGSSLGYRHKEESRVKISAASIGEKNPMFGKPRPAGAGSPSQHIQVTDLEKDTSTIYNSMSEAAKALNIDVRIMSRYFSNNQKKPYKKRYVFTKIT